MGITARGQGSNDTFSDVLGYLRKEKQILEAFIEISYFSDIWVLLGVEKGAIEARGSTSSKK